MTGKTTVTQSDQHPQWRWCVQVRYKGIWEVLQTTAPHRARAKCNIRERLANADTIVEKYGRVYSLDLE